MKRYLWIGSLEDKNIIKEKIKKGYNSSSAFISQKNLIEGLENQFKASIDSINESIVPPYPLYKDKNIKRTTWCRGKSYNVNVGFKNFKYINKLFARKSMLKEAQEWIKKINVENDEVIIFVYSLRSAPMVVANYLKSKILKCRCFIFISDLPEFMDVGESKFKKILKKFDKIVINKRLNDYEGYFLYTMNMKKKLRIDSSKCYEMEGTYNPKEFVNFNNKHNSSKKVIVYSGKLDKMYGIDLLVDAFMEIADSNFELLITGGGDSIEYIKDKSKIDKRIKYLGFLPTRNDVLKLQQEADLLINMRLPSEEASNYCFPSKLFEYLVSGTPVLSFRLGGIPTEYNKFLYFIETEDKNSIKNSIVDFFKIDKQVREKRGNEGREFILQNKTIEIQCQKISKIIYKNMN